MILNHNVNDSTDYATKQHESSLPDLQNIMGTNKEEVHNKAYTICAAQECQKRQYDAKHES